MDFTSDSNFHRDPSRQRHSRSHSSRYSHHRYHRHSSGKEKQPAKFYKNLKKRRLEEEPKRQHLQKIENFFIKNILSIFGIIFLAGAIWFGIGTWRSVERSSVFTYEKSKDVEQTISRKITSLKSMVLSPESVRPVQVTFQASFIITMVCSLVFILTLLMISARQKKIILKTISFLAWIIVASWLMIKYLITPDIILFYGSAILLSVFSALYFVSGFVDSYIGRSKWKYRTEYWLILINSLFYFFVMIALIYKSGYKQYISAFIFLTSTIHLITIYYADKKNLIYNKVPYLIATLIITCSFLPVIIRISPLIVFLAPLSVFLILFSRYSRNQTSVLFSLAAMLIMAFIYVYQWIFSFLPDILIRDNVINTGIFYKGLVSSFFILPAFAINNRLLKRHSISFSQKLLSKGKYLKYIKGALLLIIYLSFYWLFNYLVKIMVRDERLNYLIWFSFNCLYFIIYIPHLARQRSSFLRLIVVISLVTSLAYFTIIHLNIVHLRNLYIKAEGISIYPFLFHYITLALLIGMLYILLRYFKRAFAGKKTLIKGFWVFLYLISVFMVLSEMDHLAILYGFHHGIKMDEVIDQTRKLPYSLILFLSFFIVLLAGFLIKSRFLRIFSLVILTAILVKILAYDMISLKAQLKMILFLIMGLFLLGISVYYPRIKQSFWRKDTPQMHDSPVNKKHRR